MGNVVSLFDRKKKEEVQEEQLELDLEHEYWDTIQENNRKTKERKEQERKRNNKNLVRSLRLRTK